MPADDALDLVDEALDNLVNQFANPLDFLRELVQNSIDAGTPQVDVRIEWHADPGDESKGVVEIQVQDHGEGMDEEIIDKQLTRMFASSKEDDLTKIGKFGIGFTSVFAIQPEAVLLRTGRHGQSWELRFHPDRSFDKVRVSQPIEGTQISLFKTIPADRLPALVHDCRWTLRYWCEHSDIPIRFADRTRAEAQQTVVGDSPFAAFASPQQDTEAEVITTHLSLDSSIQLEHRAGGIQVAIGFSDRPRYGFYNTGLTLVNTRSPDVLGELAGRLAHLGIKVKSRLLEHTLTRDNVLQDQHWDQAMTEVMAAADLLRGQLLERIHQAQSEPEALPALLELLSQEARASPLESLSKVAPRIHVPTMEGGSVCLSQIEEQEDQEGCVLIGCESTPLLSELRASGVMVLRDHPAVREVLLALRRPGFLFGSSPQSRELRAADEVYVLPQLLEIEALDGQSLGLLRLTEELLCVATGDEIRLRLGVMDSGDGGAEQLAMDGPVDGGLFRRGAPARSRGLWSGLRCLLLDRRHPSWESYRTLYARDPLQAASGLAHLLLTDTGEASRSELHRLFGETLARTGASA